VSTKARERQGKRILISATTPFFFLSPRGTSGERNEERGNPNKMKLLSPALSSACVGREGEDHFGYRRIRYNPIH
jgi:hypothetical protein